MSKSTERYERNLEMIRQVAPELAVQLDEMPITGVRLLPSTIDDETMVGQIWDNTLSKWVPICDDDPWTQAKNDVDAFYNRETRVFTLMGHGLGYVSAELARRMEPHQRLGLFELDPSLWKASMYAVDLTQVMTGHRIDTMIGDGMVKKAENWWLSLHSQDKLNIMPPIRSGYTNAYEKEQYDALGMYCLEMLRYHAVGISTWGRFGYLIGNNDFNNLPEYLLTPGMEQLGGTWKDKPAICIAAGPSLKKNLKLLTNPDVRARVAVICVGTVYPVVKGLGIEPDIVTTIDFQRLNFTDQFLNVELPTDTSLVYLHSTWHETVRRWPGPKFVALNSSDTVGWFTKVLGSSKASAAQAQTVAHLNVICAQMLGANPIILLGQDLSMPIGEHHAPGSSVQDTSPEQNLGAHVEAQDIHGDLVWTRHSFLSMRTVFSKLATDDPHTTYLNCTEGGLNIDGWTNKPLKDALVEALTGTSEPTRLAYTAKTIYHSYEPQIEWPNFLAAWNDMANQCQTVTQACQTIVESSKKLRRAIKDDNRDLVGEIRQGIMGHYDSINQSTIAMSIFAVRDMAIIEAISRVHPEGVVIDDEHREDPDTLEFLSNRLIDIAKKIVEAADSVEMLIFSTTKRLLAVDATLHDIADVNVKTFEPEYIHRLCALHLYGLALDCLKSKPSSEGTLPLYAHILRRQHRYTEAIGLYDFLGHDTLKDWSQSKLRRHQHRLGRHALAYFESPSLLTAISEGATPCQVDSQPVPPSEAPPISPEAD